MKIPTIQRVTGLAVAACVAVGTIFATPAFASDKITLKKDGKVLEGTIVREVEGVVWFKYTVAGVEQTQMFTAEEYSAIVKDAADPKAPAGEKKADAPSTPVPLADSNKKPDAKPGVTRGAVITLGETRDPAQGDMVGLFMTSYALDQMMPMLEEEVGNDGTGVVVLRVNSGGGALSEVQKLSDEIHNKYKKKFRTVGWIDSAISAAAMSTLCLEEIYFTSRANFGACTAWHGNLVAAKGISLERILIQAEGFSARGGYDPMIMRSMQIQQPLSATRLADGTIKFFVDETSGEIIVNRKDEILTLNSETAMKIGFSKGTADNLADLGRAMKFNEITWVGDNIAGSPYPICKAEKWNIAYRKQAKTDENNTQRYIAAYQNNFNAAKSEPTRDGRAKFVNLARQALDKIKAMVRNNPNFIQFALNMENEAEYHEFLEKEEKKLRELMR
jgi:hypothetical protein